MQAIELHGDAPERAQRRPMAENLYITIQNALPEIARVEAQFGEFADARGVAREAKHKMSVILDDVLSNVISYAYPEGGRHDIEVRIEYRDGRLIATVTDDGIAFDPLSRPAPDTSLSLEDRQVGGLGIHVVRQMADDISYRRRSDKNELTLTLIMD